MANANEYGKTSTHSSARNVNLLALNQDSPIPIIGKLVYFDTNVAGETYRAIGTVTSIVTENPSMTAGYESMTARFSDGGPSGGNDLRKSEFAVQAVFKKEKDGQWQQHGSSLPTSPGTGTKIFLMNEESIAEMLSSADLPSVGYLRGLETSPAALNLRDFSGSAGSVHISVCGRSGSGKTQMYSMVLGGYMQHEHHAILVIDPQGQWSNENGMIFSLQGFAKGLGREVSIVRVAEDIQLTMDVDILGRMMNKVNLWGRFRRMGSDNKESFSDEVAQKLASTRNFDKDPRDLLGDAFSEIANSPATLSRIYVKGERQDAFKRELLLMAGEPIKNEDGLEEIIEASELVDVESRWDTILTAFMPLHSLFASTNLSGGSRRPLGGSRGFLTDVFKVRRATDAPAPYVVLDMSPNTTLHAKAAMDKSNQDYGMQKLLDNQDIKALILMMVLDEMKKASEVAFSAGGGNLNTQIVFDEAWRYAPASKASPEIDELANMLEGFALDTRKFGIGWTYILQSPADLRYGIWKQLTFVYSGYGLVGEDVKRLEGLTDDPKQVDLYRQFIAPASTGIYPFMIMGPASPLIFTSAPMFINAYGGTDEFLEHNQFWVDTITAKRQLPNVTKDYLVSVQNQMRLNARQAAAAVAPVKKHQVGKVQKPSEPQYVPKEKPETRTRQEALESFLVKNNLPADALGKGNGASEASLLDDTPF